MTTLDIRKGARPSARFEVDYVAGAQLPAQVFFANGIVAAFSHKTDADTFAEQRNKAIEVTEIVWADKCHVRPSESNAIEAGVSIRSVTDRIYVPHHELDNLIAALQKAKELWGPKE